MRHTFLLIMAFVISVIACSQNNQVLVKGYVTYLDEDVQNATVTIYESNNYDFTKKIKKLKSIPIAKKTFEVKLDINKYYLFEVYKPEYKKSIVGFNANASKNAVADKLANKCEIDIKLFRDMQGVDYGMLNNPIEKYKFNRSADGFDNDLAFNRSIKSNLQKLINQHQSAVNKAYNKSMKNGESLFAKRKYEEAWLDFDYAQELKPGERDPGKKIKEIKKVLLKNKTENTLYNQHLAQGKKDMKSGNFVDAEKEFKIAALYKPGANEISKLLKELKNKNNQAAQKTKTKTNTTSNNKTKGFLTVTGKITENKKPSSGVTVKVYSKNDKKITHETLTKGNGTDKFILEPNDFYTVTFLKPGYLTQRITIDTKVPAEDKGYSYNYSFDIFMIKTPVGYNPKFNQESKKIAFDSKRKGFSEDKIYAGTVSKKLNNILTEIVNYKPDKNLTVNTSPENLNNTDNSLTNEIAESEMPDENEITEGNEALSEEDAALKDNLQAIRDTTVVEKLDNETNVAVYVPDDDVDYESRLDSLLNALAESRNNNDKPQEINSLRGLAATYFHLNDLESSLDCYRETYALQEKDANKEGMANSLKNMGIVFDNMYRTNKAIDAFSKALDIYSELNDIRLISEMNYRLGNAYFSQNNFDNAIKYYQSSLDIDKERGAEKDIAAAYNNLGVVFYENKDYENAVLNYEKSLGLLEKLGYKKEISISLNNLGNVNFDWKKYKKALNYYDRSVKIKTELNYENGLAVSIHNIGNVYLELGDLDRAAEYFNKSLSMADANIFTKVVYRNYKSLYDIYLAKGDCGKALEYYKLYAPSIAIDDFTGGQISELQNKYEVDVQKDEQIMQLKEELKKQKILAKYEANKKRMEIEMKNLQLKENKAQIKRQNAILYAVVAGALGLLIFLLLLYKENKQKRKANKVLRTQKEEIETQRDKLAEQNEQILQNQEEITAQRDEILEQKDFIEEQNKEITDSIHYAKRIQSAVLPPIEHVSKHLPEHFILFKPKDIVSGDFYWATEKNGKLIFTAADCTGHGVPGAFMSMLGVSFLNQIVGNNFNKEKSISASEILDLLKQEVIKSLHQTGKEGEAKDGMDIALCVYDLKTKELQFAGANNPLYLISKDTGDIEQIKGDKMPIGIYQAKPEAKFTNHVFNLNLGDSIYIFSDGYADQFGGPKGKKLKYKKFREILIENKDKGLDEQRDILNSSIEEWKGACEQVDDILVIGMRINL